MPIAILWPTFALVLLIFGVCIKARAEHSLHLMRTKPTLQELAESDAPLSYTSQSTANLRAMFEIPTLYFALVPLLLLTGRADRLQVTLAWVFVVMRALQSFIQIGLFVSLGPKKWLMSGMTFLAANIALAAMWIVFFIEIVRSSGALFG